MIILLTIIKWFNIILNYNNNNIPLNPVLVLC